MMQRNIPKTLNFQVYVNLTLRKLTFILTIHVNSVLSLPKRQLFSITMTTRLILLNEVTDLCLKTLQT